MSSPTGTRTPAPAGRAGTAVAATGATSGKAATPGRRTTPRSVRRLRRLQTTAVVLLLTFGALVMTALGVSLSAATNAAESLTQYQRLGDARVQALAVQQAANTWALTPTDAVRTSVTDRLTTLATKLADASAVDADRDRIVPLTGALVQYSMTLQDALNARGEASAALLAQADTQLSKQLLTPLESASAVAADRVAAELNDSWLGWTIAAFVVVAGGLIFVLVLLARASHRYLNPAVALGLLAAVASMVVLTLTSGAATGAASDFTDSGRAQADAVTTVRQQVNQARADEILAVGLRSAGATYQQRWTTASTAARKSLKELSGTTAAVTNLDAYTTAHTQVTTALGKSQWDTAAGLVTGTGAAAKQFTSLDDAIATLDAGLHNTPRSQVYSVQTVIVVAMVGVIAFTVAGAWLAVWGVARRIEEYR